MIDEIINKMNKKTAQTNRAADILAQASKGIDRACIPLNVVQPSAAQRVMIEMAEKQEKIINSSPALKAAQIHNDRFAHFQDIQDRIDLEKRIDNLTVCIEDIELFLNEDLEYLLSDDQKCSIEKKWHRLEETNIANVPNRKEVEIGDDIDMIFADAPVDLSLLDDFDWRELAKSFLRNILNVLVDTRESLITIVVKIDTRLSRINRQFDVRSNIRRFRVQMIRYSTNDKDNSYSRRGENEYESKINVPCTVKNKYWSLSTLSMN